MFWKEKLANDGIAPVSYTHLDVYKRQAYLCILWREEVTAPLRVFALRTITYGLACAPFQALRTLQRLAQDEAVNFPTGAAVLSRNIFVDDIAAGADSKSELCKLQRELILLLSSGAVSYTHLDVYKRQEFQ